MADLLQDAAAVLGGVLDRLALDVAGHHHLHLVRLAAVQEDQAALGADQVDRQVHDLVEQLLQVEDRVDDLGDLVDGREHLDRIPLGGPRRRLVRRADAGRLVRAGQHRLPGLFVLVVFAHGRVFDLRSGLSDYVARRIIEAGRVAGQTLRGQ